MIEVRHCVLYLFISDASTISILPPLVRTFRCLRAFLASCFNLLVSFVKKWVVKISSGIWQRKGQRSVAWEHAVQVKLGHGSRKHPNPNQAAITNHDGLQREFPGDNPDAGKNTPKKFNVSNTHKDFCVKCDWFLQGKKRKNNTISIRISVTANYFNNLCCMFVLPMDVSSV